MSKYSKRPLDFAGLKTVPLQERGGKVKTADFASVFRAGSGVAGWLDSLPRILAGNSFRAVVDALAAARARQRSIIWARPPSTISKSRWPATPARMWRPCCRMAVSARPRRPAAK